MRLVTSRNEMNETADVRMRRRSAATLVGFVAAVSLSTSVHAYQTLEGHVTLVEPTYMPTTIQFSMDSGSSLCPVGAWLRWSTPNNTDRNKVVYATLVAAFTSGNRIRLYINDGDTTCTGVAMHLIE